MSRKSIAAALGLALLSILPFARGLHYAFVFDDHGVIEENAFLAEPANVVKAATLQTLPDASIIDSGRPVVILTYFIDRLFWGLEPAGYRFTNWLLHALASVLVWRFLCRFLPSARLAFVCALLFAWHPLVVEPVQSPAFREDLLCLVFGAGFFLQATRPGLRAVGVAACATWYALALLSKESAVVFAAVVPVAWWWFPARRPDRRVMAGLVAALTLLTAGWAWLVLAGRPVQSVGIEWNGLSFRGGESWWTMPWLAGWHVGRMIWPHGLSIDYTMRPVSGPLDLRFIVGGIVLVGGAVTAWMARGKKPSGALSIAWLFLLFLPVSNLLPLLNPVADRYAYAMLPGAVLLAGCLLGRWADRAVPVALVVALVYGGWSFMRVADWRDDASLWRAALEVTPDSARAHTWLGLQEKAAGNRMAAWEFFSRAEDLNPHDPSPSVNKAILSGEMGDLSDAETRLRRILEQYPAHEPARRNLAYCLRLQGRETEAAAVEAGLDGPGR